MRAVSAWLVLVLLGWLFHPVLAVATTNLPPTIGGTPTLSVVSNSAYSFAPVASDPEAAKLTFSITKKPAWATFNTATGVLSGMPTGKQAAVYSGIVISVSDGKLRASLPPFNITVNNPAPVIGGTPAATVIANSAYSFLPTVTDPNGDALVFSIAKKPTWATFNTTTGALTGTPPSAKAGSYAGIAISVSDGKNKISLPPFTITVSNPAPTLTGEPLSYALVNGVYTFKPEAKDPNGDVLKFSIVKKPKWATFDTKTGLLSGKPSAAHIKTPTKGIVISVSDGKNKVSLKAFDLTVLATVPNNPPVIGGVPATNVTVGQAYMFTPTASDEENDTLTFAIANKPAWAAFDTATGTLSGAPAVADVGTTSDIVVSVTDGKSPPVNLLPAFSISVTANTIQSTLTAPITAGTDDVEENTATGALDKTSSDLELVYDGKQQAVGLRFQNAKIPQGVTIKNAYIQFRTDEVSSSAVSLTIKGDNADNSAVFNGAYNVSSRPVTTASVVWTPAAWTVVDEVSAAQRTPDLSAIVQEIVNRGGWAVNNAMSFIITGDGSTNKRVADSFEDGWAPKLVVEFEYINKAPVIANIPTTVVPKTAAINTQVLTVSASDPDGDSLTYSLEGNVPFAIDTTGKITLKAVPQQETHTFNVKVSDGKATTTVPVTVLTLLNVALAPESGGFGVATQSSTYDSSSAASKAIDGNLATTNHTNCLANDWWQVKLPDPTLVSRIVVTGRESWASRLAGAEVYVSANSATNGGMNAGDKVFTLAGTANAQNIPLTTPKSGLYVIVKAAPTAGGGTECLHMREVEVYGQAPAAPVLNLSAYSFQLSHRVGAGQLVGKVNAVDYQKDAIAYSLVGAGLPFVIDAQGNITVSGVLQAGMTYNFIVNASDGINKANAPVTVVVTSSASIEDALRTGDASVATSEELLDATIAALASQKTTPSLLTALYGSDPIAYTPGNRTQLINFKPWVDSVFPIVVGNKGNTLAVAGTTPTARYAAFGISPMELFQANKSLTFETPFSRLLAWLLAGEPVNTNALSGNRKVALSFVSSEHTEIKAWIAKKYPSWTVTDCNTVATLATCYGSADLVVTGWQGNNADAQTIRQALATVMGAGKPVLYLHTWYEDYNDVAHAIADLLKFSLPYGGNFWADDAANWTNVTAMQTAIWEKQGLAGIEKMLKHFKANDYSIATRNEEFYPGANKVRAVMTLLDENKVNLFQSNESRLYRLLALLGDSYRQEVVFPMDMDATNATVFLKSLFADHAVYNYRILNRVQADMGNFSRSNFSHITPVTKTVTMTSRQNFRAAGVYALPGKTVRVTRNDNSSTTTKVFINSLRSGSTHEYETWGYKRPKFLESAHVPIKSGETITLTSPYGGPIQIDFGTNDQSVSFTFEQVGEHPFWDDTSDNADFTAKLAKGDYDWAEFVTPAFEIHSTLEKMRESVSNTRWGGTLEGFAAATMRYIHNFPHVLAGFKGPNIDVVPEIHDFATANGFTIENLDLVKHMNADQATCGAGCSGNPYDAYWAFDPIGHGDIHEMGHGLEKSRFRLEGWNYHASTNPYSYYSKTQYYKTTEGDPDCQSLPFKDAFVALQASVGRANPAAYLKTNYWDAVEDNWSRAASMTIQMMMTAEHQGALVDGWHLLARLHILEREFNRAMSDTTAWDAKKTSLGFASYSKAEADAISSNDWMVIAVSKVTGMDYRDYFSMWGQAFSTKANAQVVAFNHAAAERRFFVTSPNGYCKGEGFDGNFLPVTGSQVWPLAGAQPRLMGDSFR